MRNDLVIDSKVQTINISMSSKTFNMQELEHRALEIIMNKKVDVHSLLTSNNVTEYVCSRGLFGDRKRMLSVKEFKIIRKVAKYYGLIKKI